MEINDIKHLAVERIYLVPDASEGQLGYVWCDDPAPGIGMDASEAVEYVRKDVHDARIAELEAQVEQHRVAEETQIALRQKADEREAALAAHIEELKPALEVWLGYGDKLVADIYATDGSWAGVGIFEPEDGKTHGIGERDCRIDGAPIADSRPLLMIKSHKPESLQVVVEELQESLLRMGYAIEPSKT